MVPTRILLVLLGVSNQARHSSSLVEMVNLSVNLENGSVAMRINLSELETTLVASGSTETRRCPMEPKQYRDWSAELERMQPKRERLRIVKEKAMIDGVEYTTFSQAEEHDAPQTPLELWLAYAAFAVGAVCVAAVMVLR